LYRKKDEDAGTMYDTCYESSVKYVSRTLDSFGIKDVYFAKIDVEGHEPEVLRGGNDTLR
jgi:FkbM family methyltransferase